MVELLIAAKAKVVVSEYPAAAGFYRGWNRIERVTASRAGTGRGRGRCAAWSASRPKRVNSGMVGVGSSFMAAVRREMAPWWAGRVTGG